MLMQNFAGQIRCVVGDVQVAYVHTVRYTSSDTKTIQDRIGLLFTHDDGDLGAISTPDGANLCQPDIERRSSHLKYVCSTFRRSVNRYRDRSESRSDGKRKILVDN